MLVIDAGEPRNAPAAHMHSYPGFDGVAPGEYLRVVRAELQRYGVALRSARVDTVSGSADSGFELHLAGQSIRARRVLLATGLVDELPDIPGVRAQWGRGVVHCPYCHGWELRDQRVVVIGTSEHAPRQALLFR